jgi:hypothetical protein
VSGKPGVMSMSVSPTFSASNTRESGMSFCTKMLVVVLPEPWVPLIQMITETDATRTLIQTAPGKFTEVATAKLEADRDRRRGRPIAQEHAQPPRQIPR